MSPATWDQRIRRADELARTHPFAADVLRFYQRVATLQKGLYQDLQKSSTADLDALLPKASEFLRKIKTAAPEPIAQSAAEWEMRDARELIEFHWWSAPAEGGSEALLASLFLQPYAEYLAERGAGVTQTAASSRCPFCARKPVAGILRPEGDGAKRSLLCSMCATEWAIGRIWCPACGEENVDKLAIYTAEQFAYVRVEACDTCGCYIKTVDLTKNGRAVPMVDELATIPLNLWAQEHHYVKVGANMLGI